MTQIQYPNDVTGSIQIVHGSDGRLNVSSRSDERIFYVSRDRGQAYSIRSFDAAAAVDEYSLYFKNTSTDKNFYVKSIDLSPGVDMTFKISTVTGTAAGTPITPVNLNLSSGNAAEASVFGNAAVTNLTEASVLDTHQVLALTSTVVDFNDALILGQNDNIAVECDVNAGGTVTIVMVGHFE